MLDGGASPHLLDTYESERMPHVREYIELAIRLGRLINATAQETALAGMEASAGGPAKMATLKPRLGPGLYFGSVRLSARRRRNRSCRTARALMTLSAVASG